ncbi:MBL fold metallo-hydrolase [Corallococcus macrosporus]|uniref:Metallo-beta-lactamase domain-containing protein n=1 Tax=Corallococcus macrosporus DSM 14697 TaxID=1189310 RepID=A0A250JLF7_9BACT|nr:MBL fold metallo-hydrolase [Corallococcus macrosporus]ATB44478.1 hypothetical protein MYMAC_000049 [Corallococcus macrosporus DSM 14697]
MTSPASLESLTRLNREWLHVFVAGPGQGEGLAVALPERGWLLVDGCSTADGRFPLEEVLRRWRGPADDPLHAMVLTHPHEDHVEGFAELLEELNPENVAVAAAAAPGKTLLDVARELIRGVDEAAPERLLSRKVVAAMRAVDTWEDRNPGRLMGLSDGMSLPLKGRASVEARAPDAEGIKAFLDAKGLASRLRKQANHLSLLLEVRFGTLCLVLAGDLPFLNARGGTPVPTGWETASRRHSHLGSHHGLKVPHHGSTEAMHPGWMTPRGTDSRAWLVTPYNSSKLPRLTRLEGLPRLLEHEPEVLLTAIPASKRVQAEQQVHGRISIAQLVER